MRIAICDFCNQEIKPSKGLVLTSPNMSTDTDVCELCLQSIKSIKIANTTIAKSEILKRWAERL